MPPPATVHRLRPRNQGQIEMLQGTLDLGDWPEHVRIALTERLALNLPETLDRWSFVMVTSAADQMREFLRAVGSGPRAFSTLAVWYALLPFVRRDTCEIVCGQRKIAETAGICQGDVSRAMARLVEIGVLLQEGRGKYRVHPAFAWKGTLANREKAATAAPKLKLVQADRAGV